MSTPRTGFNLSAIALWGLAVCVTATTLLGCGEDIDKPNEAARIEAVGQLTGPIEACGIEASDVEPGAWAQLGRHADALAIPYLIRDREADAQDIRVEICTWANEQPTDCGVARMATGGDGATGIPTAPAGQCVLHVFNWAVGCGRFVTVEGGSAPPTRALAPVDQPLVARISVVGSNQPPSQSQPFTLLDVGFDALPGCD